MKPTPEHLAQLRAQEIARLNTLRSFLIPHLFGSERERKAASLRLQRLDTQLTRLGGNQQWSK